MIKIAAATNGETVNSIVPDLFEEATHLLLLDGDTGVLMQNYCFEDDKDTAARSLAFADKVVNWDCEALLCGEIEAEPFAVLAEKNSVTRYMAAGLTAAEALVRMNLYELYFLDDHRVSSE